MQVTTLSLSLPLPGGGRDDGGCVQTTTGVASGESAAAVFVCRARELTVCWAAGLATTHQCEDLGERVVCASAAAVGSGSGGSGSSSSSSSSSSATRAMMVMMERSGRGYWVVSSNPAVVRFDLGGSDGDDDNREGGNGVLRQGETVTAVLLGGTAGKSGMRAWVGTSQARVVRLDVTANGAIKEHMELWAGLDEAAPGDDDANNTGLFARLFTPRKSAPQKRPPPPPSQGMEVMALEWATPARSEIAVLMKNGRGVLVSSSSSSSAPKPFSDAQVLFRRNNTLFALSKTSPPGAENLWRAFPVASHEPEFTLPAVKGQLLQVVFVADHVALLSVRDGDENNNNEDPHPIRVFSVDMTAAGRMHELEGDAVVAFGGHQGAAYSLTAALKCLVFTPAPARGNRKLSREKVDKAVQVIMNEAMHDARRRSTREEVGAAVAVAQKIKALEEWKELAEADQGTVSLIDHALHGVLDQSLCRVVEGSAMYGEDDSPASLLARIDQVLHEQLVKFSCACGVVSTGICSEAFPASLAQLGEYLHAFVQLHSSLQQLATSQRTVHILRAIENNFTTVEACFSNVKNVPVLMGALQPTGGSEVPLLDAMFAFVQMLNGASAWARQGGDGTPSTLCAEKLVRGELFQIMDIACQLPPPPDKSDKITIVEYMIIIARHCLAASSNDTSKPLSFLLRVVAAARQRDAEDAAGRLALAHAKELAETYRDFETLMECCYHGGAGGTRDLAPIERCLRRALSDAHGPWGPFPEVALRWLVALDSSAVPQHTGGGKSCRASEAFGLLQLVKDDPGHLKRMKLDLVRVTEPNAAHEDLHWLAQLDAGEYSGAASALLKRKTECASLPKAIAMMCTYVAATGDEAAKTKELHALNRDRCLAMADFMIKSDMPLELLLDALAKALESHAHSSSGNPLAGETTRNEIWARAVYAQHVLWANAGVKNLQDTLFAKLAFRVQHPRIDERLLPTTAFFGKLPELLAQVHLVLRRSESERFDKTPFASPAVEQRLRKGLYG